MNHCGAPAAASGSIGICTHACTGALWPALVCTACLVKAAVCSHTHSRMPPNRSDQPVLLCCAYHCAALILLLSTHTTNRGPNSSKRQSWRGRAKPEAKAPSAHAGVGSAG